MAFPIITKKYIEENRRNPAIRTAINPPNRKKINGARFQVSRAVFRHFLTLYRLLIWIFQSTKYARLIKNTKLLRNSAINRKVLLIGNGPSSGYVDSNGLDVFRELGGITIGVNHWDCQQHLQAHVPDWLVLSDPESLDTTGVNSERARSLIEYISINDKIKLLVPFPNVGSVSALFGYERVYGFCDLEVSMNIFGTNILRPRSYSSMTLYKALAFAKYINPEFIYILGMDNNFFKKIVVDENNKIFVTTQYPDYEVQYEDNVFTSIALKLADYSRNMSDLDIFSPVGVVNLDTYSLVDRFKKINIPPDEVQNFITEYGLSR